MSDTTKTPDSVTPEEPKVLLAPVGDPPAPPPPKSRVQDMGRHYIKGRFESQ